MQTLIRRFRGGGESYGVALDGSTVSAVRVRKLGGNRLFIDYAYRIPSSAWLTSSKDVTFILRHIQPPVNFQGNIHDYVTAYAAENFPAKSGEWVVARTDGIADRDGTVPTHGLSETKCRMLLKDFAAIDIDSRDAAGLVPPSCALQHAVETLEDRAISKFTAVLHVGHAGVALIGVDEGHPVFYHTHPRLPAPQGMVAGEELTLQTIRQIMNTEHYLAHNSKYGVPDEVIVCGPAAAPDAVLEQAKLIFRTSRVRRIEPGNHVVSETLSGADVSLHALSIGAAALGLKRGVAGRVNFLKDPSQAPAGGRTDTVYDKIILGCGAAMLALAFVTANAWLLDSTKLRLARIAQNQKAIEGLRTELRNLEPELESANRLLNSAAVRFDALQSKTFSIPVSVSKLLAAIESAAPDGIVLDKLESGPGASAAQGRYANFFAQGEQASIILSGRAALPEHVIFFQDALRDKLGVSVDIVSMGREGDMWARKPVGFVIALRGQVRRA